jgi:hypothetical protein
VYNKNKKGGVAMSYFDTIKLPVLTVQLEIPRTSINTYITGQYALNIHAPETSGDWHGFIFYMPEGLEKPHTIDLAGDGLEWNTNPIYGTYGIYEGRDYLLKNYKINDDITEVYIADHFRAILDLLYDSLKNYEVVLNLNGATNDWLDTQEQKDELLSKARFLEDVFTGKARCSLDKWIEKESGPDWREL